MFKLTHYTAPLGNYRGKALLAASIATVAIRIVDDVPTPKDVHIDIKALAREHIRQFLQLFHPAAPESYIEEYMAEVTEI
jgi:hypothetical protein